MQIQGEERSPRGDMRCSTVGYGGKGSVDVLKKAVVRKALTTKLVEEADWNPADHVIIDESTLYNREKGPTLPGEVPAHFGFENHTVVVPVLNALARDLLGTGFIQTVTIFDFPSDAKFNTFGALLGQTHLNLNSAARRAVANRLLKALRNSRSDMNSASIRSKVRKWVDEGGFNTFVVKLHQRLGDLLDPNPDIEEQTIDRIKEVFDQEKRLTEVRDILLREVVSGALK